MPTYVKNTKDHLVHCHSSDGNSVPVGPKAGISPRTPVAIANRFTWQVDEGILLGEVVPEDDVDPCAHVRGRPLTALRKPPKTVAEARRLAAHGVRLHQTPAMREAARRLARRVLDEHRADSQTSGDAITAARTRVPDRPSTPSVPLSTPAPDKAD